MKIRIPFFTRRKPAGHDRMADAMWAKAAADEAELPASEPKPGANAAPPETIPVNLPKAKQAKAIRRAQGYEAAKEIYAGDESKFGLRTVKALSIPVEDRFRHFNKTTEDVVKGNLHSAVIYGTPGIGKTHTVKKWLQKLGLKEGKDWILLTSRCTPPALYETALRFRKDGIIILDDVDLQSGKDGKAMWELVKAMTDTYATRTVSWPTKGANMKLVGSTAEAEEFLAKQAKENPDKPKIPTMFGFTGRLVVITNLSETFFDEAYLSRSMMIPLFLTEAEKIEHMKNILREIEPEMDIFLKEEVLAALEKAHIEDKELNRIAGTEQLSRTQFDIRTLELALKMAKRDENWRERLFLL